MSSSLRPSPLHCPSLPHLFVISAHSCSLSILPFLCPSIHQLSCALFFTQPSLLDSFSIFPPSIHFSPSSTLLLPLITPSWPPLCLSTCIFISSLPDWQFIVSRQRTRLSLPFVIVCVFILSIYFSFSPLQSPFVTGDFQLPPVAGRWCHLVLTSYLVTTPVMCWFHHHTVAVSVCDARSHYCISAPPSVNESLSWVALDSRRVSPRRI